MTPLHDCDEQEGAVSIGSYPVPLNNSQRDIPRGFKHKRESGLGVSEGVYIVSLAQGGHLVALVERAG